MTTKAESMTALPPGLFLSTEDLFSRHGFGDGDVPDGLCDALDAAGIPYEHDQLDWHGQLCSIVRNTLVPMSRHVIELQVVETSHNPIRATTVDGHAVDRSAGEHQFPWMQHVGVLIPWTVLVPDVRRHLEQEGLWLRTSDLATEKGFDAGNTPGGFFDWCEAHQVPIPMRHDWNLTLRAAVRRHLLPRFEPLDVQVRDVDSIATAPVRLVSVDGRAVRWDAGRCRPGLPDVEVRIPWATVADLMHEAQAEDRERGSVLARR